MSPAAVLALGFLLGVRHATDADHVVAVTTCVSEKRSAREALGVGALWGLGHTLTVVLVGGAMTTLGLVVSPRVGMSLELCVAVMLVALGLLNLTGVGHSLRNMDRHAAHASSLQPVVRHRLARFGLLLLGRARPLAVGVVHGLAGSAALALLVLTTLSSKVEAMVYLLLFGAGTIIGMMLLTLVMSVPVAVAVRRFQSAERLLGSVTGFASLAFGLALAYQIGFVVGLFLAQR